MPRIIPDLEAKIIKAAGVLFVEKGYSEISMKDVAQLVGTSVGNLYNYYPSKKELFLAGRQIWIERLSEDFEHQFDSITDPRQRLEKFLSHLMDTLETWSGLWEEFLASATRELSQEEYCFLLTSTREKSRTHILAPLDSLLRQVSADQPHLQKLLDAPDMRYASSIVSTIKMLIRLFPEQKAINRQFISIMIGLPTDYHI